MKKFTGPYVAQGDLNIFEVQHIPKGVELCSLENGKHILAHSETGHHHVIDGNTARVFAFPDDEFNAYIEVDKPTNVEHLRGFDTHEAIQLPAGFYKITRQREYTPEGYRRAAD